MSADTQFDWWRAALKGERGDFDKNKPPSGYYRNRDRSLALWRDEAGELQWVVSSGYCPRQLDELCDALASFCVTPITYDVWDAHRQSGRWPEDATPEIEAAREAPGIGHNSRAANEEMTDEIKTIVRAFGGWLESIGGSVGTEEHDAKVKDFTARMADLKKKAEAAHKDAKAPILEAGREIDRTWKPVAERADKEQRLIAGSATAYRVEREKLRVEAERKAKAEVEAAKAQAAVEGKTIAVVAAQTRKQATGLRPVKTIVIDDLPTLAAQLAAMASPPADFVEACRKAASRMLDAGATVQGAHLQTEMRAA